LTLHFTGCAILIFATYSLDPVAAYTLLTSWSAYTINAFMSMWLGLGILILRFRGAPMADPSEDGASNSAGRALRRRRWSDLTGKSFNPTVSIIAGFIYCLGGVYPVVTTWIPPSGRYKELVKSPTDWWLVPVFSWCIIALGVAWFLGFITVAKHIERKDHCVFVVERRPEFEPADGSNKDSDTASVHGDGRSGGGLVQVHETVFLSWVGRETLRLRSTAAGRESTQPVQETRDSMIPSFPGLQMDKPSAYMPTQYEVPSFGAPADAYSPDMRHQSVFSQSGMGYGQPNQYTQEAQYSQPVQYGQQGQYGQQAQYGQRQSQYGQQAQYDHQAQYGQQPSFGYQGYEEQQGMYGVQGVPGQSRQMY